MAGKGTYLKVDMEKDTDRFKPKLGRIRSSGGARAKSYLNRVMNKMSAAGKTGFGTGTTSQRFSGYRIGRGNEVMRHQRAGHSFGSSFRRVIIKTRIVKLVGGSTGAAGAHMRYLQREGVAEENQPGQLYDALDDEADGKALLERSEGDRHQFRFIVSPEDANELAELKPFVRDLMKGMEDDLGTRLDWVAVDHFNTGHPHTHIVLRGKDDLGENLVVARDYISRGMRQRASAIVTRELGPPTLGEAIEKFQRQVNQDRFTEIDRELIRDSEDGIINARTKGVTPVDRFKHTMRMGRLKHLETLGLAQQTKAGHWELSPKLETTLRRSGERGDIIKTMHNSLKQAGLDVGASDFAIYDPQDKRANIVTGQIVDRGLRDELNDGHYLLVDATDGRVHHVALDPKQDMEDLPKGGIVEVHPASTGVKPADRIIKQIAVKNEGIYSPETHETFDPYASPEFIKAHVRRLEALRRMNVVSRFPDGSWKIPSDFEQRVEKLSNRQARYPGRVVLLSAFSLESQVGADGATWLDRQLVANSPTQFRGERFSKSVRAVLQLRQNHLVENGLARNEKGKIRYQKNLLATLKNRELIVTGKMLAKEMKLEFIETREESRIEGIYKRPVHLASGKFAIISKSKEFTLVPWRQALERQRGKPVSGIMRGSSLSFDFSKKRGMGLS